MAGKLKSSPERRWPTPDILRRAQFVEDAGPIRFVDTEAAARYLALEAHTLECYRSLGGGPVFHKFSKWVRYAVDDLDAWAASCRRAITSNPPPALNLRALDQLSVKPVNDEGS